MRVALVSGSRDLKDRVAVWSVLDEFDPDMVVHGDCPTGADKMADDWAKMKQVQIYKFPADWTSLGRKAGPIRNRQMCEWARGLPADMVVRAFAFPRGRSAGTRGFMAIARSLDLDLNEL